MRLHVAPTYACTRRCDYCSTREAGRRFREALSIEAFEQTIDALVAQGLTSVSFIGGEPTLWPHLARAFEHVARRGLQRLLYTNGHRVVAIPDSVTVNVTPFRAAPLSAAIIDTLGRYRAGGARVVLRWNLPGDDPTLDVERAALAALLLDAGVSLSVVDPRPHDEALGRRLAALVRDLRELGVGVALSRPLPACSIPAEDHDDLERMAGLTARCTPERAIPVLNPDGVTVHPCNAVPRALPLAYVWGDRAGFVDWTALCDGPGVTLPAACAGCPERTAGRCHAGCLAPYVSTREAYHA